MKIRRFLPLALCLLGMSSLAFAQTPLTPEIRVNVSGPPLGGLPPASVAMNARGEFVVAWGAASAASRDQVLLARVFDADGTPRTGEILVSGQDTSAFGESAVAIREDGSFLVVYNVREAGRGRVQGRIFAADGAPRSEILPIASTYAWSLSVASRSDGGFLVAWAGPAGGGGPTNNKVRYRLLDSEGEAVTPLRDLGWGVQVSVAAGSGDEMVLVWQGLDPRNPRSAVLAQRLRPNGERHGPRIVVTPKQKGGFAHTSVAVEDDGGFLVVWTAYDRGTFARRFRGNRAVPEEVRVLLSPGIGASGIGLGPQDDFVLSWTFPRELTYDLSVQRFDRDGSPLGPGFSLGTANSSFPYNQRIAADGAGNFVVIWQTGHFEESRLLARVFRIE